VGVSDAVSPAPHSYVAFVNSFNDGYRLKDSDVTWLYGPLHSAPSTPLSSYSLLTAANGVPDDAVSGPGFHDDFDSDLQTATTQPEADAENSDESRYSFTDSGNAVRTLLAPCRTYYLITL
jgi:hypothetical protein